MDGIVPPVFLIDGYDVEIFASAEDAANHTEGWAVEEGVEAYDAHARPLTLFMEGDRTRIALSGEPPMPEHLEESLRRYLSIEDARARDPACDFECLIRIAGEYTTPATPWGALRRWLGRVRPKPGSGR